MSQRAPPAPGPPRRRACPPAGTGPPPPPAAAAASSHCARIRAGPRRAAGPGHRERTIKTFYIFIAAGLAGLGGVRAGDLDGRGGAWRGPEVAASTMPVGGGARADPGGRTPARGPQDWEPARAAGRCSPRGAPGGGALPPAVRGVRVGPNPGVTARAPQPRPARARGSGLTPARVCLW